ncbi:MAG: pyruvate formate-lyase [Ruminococcaceae bacterium]|nr:pyruvate formate-lyase [Oscillospiraceae bacterium]
MTERVKRQLKLLNDRTYRKLRHAPEQDPETVILQWDKQTEAGEAARFAYACFCEKEAVFHGEDLFGFNRYCSGALPEKGRFGNIVIDYDTVLAKGLCGILEDVDARRPTADAKARAYYDAIAVCYNATFGLVDMYEKAAREAGNLRLADALLRVPRRGARDYYEALIMLRFLSYILRLCRCVHLPLGRFDRYMRPYYDASVAAGASEAELLELTELFFIAMNFDTDLYIGIQKGDNGQSLVLGGCDKQGNEVFGPLSEICLQASEELALIDPKINLRVNKNTPLSLYERGTKLTKQGLGFPQYSNDDIAIPFLTSLGYDLEDARDYAMAACWEFIVSGNGADIPNRNSFDYPKVIEKATREALPGAESFEAFLEAVGVAIERECDALIAHCNARPATVPEVLISSFVSPTIERGRDISGGGAKYNNYGLHGAGLSTAADALAAIRECVFERKYCTKEELLAALEADFVGYESLQRKLLDCPKMGNNDDRADRLGCYLMQRYSSYLNGKPNNRGGIYRAGTGSAMVYITHAAAVGATADGRRAGAPFASSYSPSPDARLRGPLSNIQSFTKFDLRKICNGGPFTIEIHDTVFRNDEGERKVAQLVKTYIDLGGHQIQINAINRDRLLDAQAHPENYPNLIVRVWGWSGYFTELDTVYQNHIIKRMEFTV